MVIELMQFRLLPEASVDEFLTADHRLQTEFAYQQPGLLRRTTARGNDGEWVVIDHWRSAELAYACSEQWEHDEIAQAFMRFVDSASVRVQRYSTV
jgi:hypothetical protein